MTTSSDKDKAEKNQKTVRCVVVSDKMSKSRVGRIERIVKYSVNGKYIKRSSKVMFHDETNMSKIGDEVLVAACRPISAHKSFKLVSIVKEAKEAFELAE